MNPQPAITKLIINGDDYGLSPGVNKGIQHLHERGRLTSASLLVNTPWSEDAFSYVRQDRRLRIGVHLNLTTGRPVLPASTVPSLVAADGCFYNTSSFLLRLLTGRLNLSEIEAELGAQIKSCLQNGIQPTHVDTHMHLHAFTSLGNVVAELARQFDIPVVRNPDLFVAPVPPFGSTHPVKEAIQKPVTQVLQSTQRLISGRSQNESRQMGGADHVIYLRWCVESGDDPYFGFKECLNRLDGNTIEVVAHPAEEDDFLPALSNYVVGRQRELEFLGSSQFSQLVAEEPITIAH